MNTIEAWSKVSLSIKNDSRISDASRRAYIKTLVPLKEENNILYLMAPSLTNKKTVEVKYYDIIREHIQLVTGKDYIIKIINNDKTQIEPPKLRIVSKNSVISSYRFDNFIVGSSNQLAHAASYAVAKSPGKDYNPLFLYGGVGLGKTHLMNAIANYILEKNPESKIAYITCENFVNELVKALKENENEKFREKYRKLDVLLIDDIQFITGKAGTQEEFFHTFNSLYNENKQIIIASDRPPDEIKNLTIRLSSRFTSGLMADINPPDIETRIAILKQKSEEQNFHIDDDVIYYIAENVTSNVRELVGALTKVKAYKQPDRPDNRKRGSFLYKKGLGARRHFNQKNTGLRMRSMRNKHRRADRQKKDKAPFHLQTDSRISLQKICKAYNTCGNSEAVRRAKPHLCQNGSRKNT